MGNNNLHVALFGGGPANLMAAYLLSKNNLNITIFEKENNVAQKFLVAGKGGFNLTNKSSGKELYAQYFPRGFLDKALIDFDTNSLRNFLRKINIPTFIGSSGKVFPEKDIKPFEVLNNFLSQLTAKNVKILTEHKFVGFDNNNMPLVKYGSTVINIKADYYIFALGGASWKKTGSDGAWLNYFDEIGVKTLPFQPSNCGININWSSHIKKYHSGKPLKNIAVTVNKKRFLGEAVITDYGLEGNVIYKTVPELRQALTNSNKCYIFIDFKPFNLKDNLSEKISGKNTTTGNYSKLLNLNNSEIALIKKYTSKETYNNKKLFINSVKALQIPVESLRPIDEAISTVGGIATIELNKNFSLKKHPHIFTIGEMVDWDAPTGGFLLQACFSMGNFSAKAILNKLSLNNSE